MARKPRLEFGGAIYHVISRGNYRKDVFAGRSAEAFEKALFEACQKCHWRLHAYVIMSNHYHLALETPEPNLVDGMKWLQGTFANRFNAFHDECGHVFQSRYKSLLIEEGRSLLGLVNYIHLNPVRAGLATLAELQTYPWSSFPKYFAKKVKPPLIRGEFLSVLEFPDSVSGMKQYARHLERCEETDPAKHDEIVRRYCQGWAVAGNAYRKELRARFRDGIADPSGREFRELKEARWEIFLKEKLREEEKSPAAAAQESKAASWKVRVATALRSQTTATNAWIAQHLVMGHPSRVRNLIRDNEKL